MIRPTAKPAGLLIFNPSVDLTVRIGEQCARSGRSQCWCVLKWGRMFWEKYKVFFARKSQDMEFRLYYKMVYD